MESQDAPGAGAAVEATAGSTLGAAGSAGERPHGATEARVPSAERHIWALAALLVPLLFTAMVAIGVVLMLKRHMAFFRPAPSGAIAVAPVRLAGAHAHQDGAASEAA
jgi:hypothetical protein